MKKIDLWSKSGTRIRVFEKDRDYLCRIGWTDEAPAPPKRSKATKTPDDPTPEKEND